MRLSCLRSELREALRVVGGVVDPRNIKPILQDIHIRTTDDCLEISATDLELGMKYLVRNVEIENPGGIVVPANPLHGVVNESRDERLTLYTEDMRLIVEGRGTRFEMMGLSEEEFPEIPGFPDGNSLEIEGAILSEMIEKTIFAVAVEKQRFALNGVLFVTKERSTRIEMVATDGRRLALIRRKANAACPFTASPIIPVKALQQAAKMIGDEDIVKVQSLERQILMRTENGILCAQLVEGRFPAYAEVIPDDSDKRLDISVDDLMSGIRQAAVLSGRDSRAVRLKASADKVILESSDPEAGQAHIELDVKYEGEPIEIRFNPDFLLDGLKAIDDESVRMEMKDASQAAVMRGGSDYVYLIMPITEE